MGDQSSKVPPRVTVEDLLRLKCSERPAPEFWTDFERALRQRQLAALVEKRSWWRPWLMARGRLTRWSLPVATAAVAGLAIVASRSGFLASRDAPGREAVPASAPRPAAVSATLASQPDRESSPAVRTDVRPSRAEAVASPLPEKNPAVVAVSSTSRAHPEAAPISWLGDVLDDQANRAEVNPPAQSIAVDLASVMPAGPDLVEAVVRPLGFEERAMPVARPPHRAELLPTAVAVTEPRRARLLASLGSAGVYAPEFSAPEHARRSVLRYLTEDGWDRSLSRLEAEGDKLSIKF